MIDQIKLGEVDYPVKFGMNTLRIFTKQFNISLNKLGNIGDMNYDILLELMFAGIKEGLKAEGRQLTITIEDFCEALDERGKFDEILEIFVEQFSGGEPEGNQKVPAKKKSTGTK